MQPPSKRLLSSRSLPPNDLLHPLDVNPDAFLTDLLLDQFDWDCFSRSTQYLSHGFHPYPARFIPYIPASLINFFTAKGDTVLDPFCGCGTTLVESFLRGRHAIGSDLNPLAVLISQVKTTYIPTSDFDFFHSHFHRVHRYLSLDNCRTELCLSASPHITPRLFTRAVIDNLAAIRAFLLDLKDDYPDLYHFGSVAFSSILWSLIESGVQLDIPSLFLKQVRFMQGVLLAMADRFPPSSSVTVLQGDARTLPVPDSSVHLIVTSPPYVNVMDYAKLHTFSMLWLGLDFDQFSKHEIGSHARFSSNRFRLLSEYLADLLRSLLEMCRVLHPARSAVVVVSLSQLDHCFIPTHLFVQRLARTIGLTPRKIILRHIDPARKYQQPPSPRTTEYLVFLSKTDEPPVPSTADSFVHDVVQAELQTFRAYLSQQPLTAQGTPLSKERLQQHLSKLDQALASLPQDIRMKKSV